MTENPQITLRLSADQIEDIVQVLGFALASDNAPIDNDALGELYDTLSAHVDEHVVFPDEEDDEKGNHVE